MKRLFLHLGLLFIITGISVLLIDNVSYNINSYYTDIEKSKELLDSVNFNYKSFKEKSLTVKDNIKDVSESFNIYLDDFKEKNIDIITKINNIESEIIEISDISTKLNENCKYDLNNKNMESKCNNYKENYKNMIDSYDEMINVYNEVVDIYNEYQENNKVNKYQSGIKSKVNELISIF